VKGPGPFNVSTRPAAFSAVANVLNEPAETAVSTMSILAAFLAATVVARVFTHLPASAVAQGMNTAATASPPAIDSFREINMTRLLICEVEKYEVKRNC
jgi:hypothetical protein